MIEAAERHLKHDPDSLSTQPGDSDVMRTSDLGDTKGVCPLRGDRTRGLAPFVGVGEAGFRAEPTTVARFDSSRRLHTALRVSRRVQSNRGG